VRPLGVVVLQEAVQILLHLLQRLVQCLATDNPEVLGQQRTVDSLHYERVMDQWQLLFEEYYAHSHQSAYGLDEKLRFYEQLRRQMRDSTDPQLAEDLRQEFRYDALGRQRVMVRNLHRLVCDPSRCGTSRTPKRAVTAPSTASHRGASSGASVHRRWLAPVCALLIRRSWARRGCLSSPAVT